MSGGGPIFLGGLARSGKTQLRIALGAHPDISMTRRTYLWPLFYGRFGDLDDPVNLKRCLTAMVADEGVRKLEPDPERIRREFRAGAASYARLFALVHAHHAERLGKRRWGDQLGFVERFADPIFAAFPSARMIHMVRDPRHLYVMEAGAGRRGKLGWETAMWLCSARLADRNRRRHPGRYCIVRYETFAARPLETARAVCGFLGEEYHRAMEDALATVSFDRHPAASPKAYDQRRSQVAFIETYAGRELHALDYAAERPALSLGQRLSFVIMDRPLNRMTMTAWRVLRAGIPAAGLGG